jgi:alpha-mannosidase
MRIRVLGALVGAAGLAFATAPALAYTIGSGTLLTDNFNATPLSADWELGNGVTPNPSPWTQVLDGVDRVLYADGQGPFFNSPTKHWTRHWLQPVPATSFAVAFEYRAELGATYVFDVEVQQRAAILKKYRMRVDGAGAVSLWRTVSGTYAQLAITGSGVVPVNQKRWLRFEIDPDPSGHPRLRARVWSGGASSEPASWTIDALDANDTLVRIHRMELTADGPKGIETWIDDLDAWGDLSVGVDSSIKTIYLMEASHLDIGFTDPPDTVEAFYKDSLDQVLANLDADPAYRWQIEEAWDLDRWWERSTDTERQNMVAKLQEGRLRLGAGYASLHTTTAGHEEMTRNVYWSSRFAREHAFPLRTYVQDDVPGATFALPEILSRSGIDFYVGGMNTPFGGRLLSPNHGDRPFWWVGPDGSKVLSWVTFDSYAEGLDYGFSFFDDLAALHSKLGKKLPENEEAGYDWTDFLMMRAFDNSYQAFHQRDLVNQWNAAYQNPKFVLATPDEFFDHMLAVHGPGAFPSFSGDFGAAWSNSHAIAQNTERMVRDAHRHARAAETLLAAGSVLDRAPAPRDAVDAMYRNMLQVDEHSGAGGWDGYFTPEEMDRNNTIHLGYAHSAQDASHQLAAQGLDRALSDLPAAGNAVAVVNSLGRARDGVARIALPPEVYGTAFRVVDRVTSLELPYQRLDPTSEILFRATGVPSMGYKVFDLVSGPPSAVPAGMLTVTATTLENDFYRLLVDPATGALTSLYDKTRGKEMIDASSPYRFNQLASSTKSQADGGAAPVASPPASATSAVGWTGPVAASLTVSRTGSPHTGSTYRLYRGEDRVEIDNTLDRALMPYVNHQTASQAWTVTLPFDIHGFQIRSETTTRFLDPLSDGFQRDNYFDWHNAEHTLAFWDGTKGALCAVDAVDAHAFEHFNTIAFPSWPHSNALLLSRLEDKTDEYQFTDGTIGPYTIEPGAPSILKSTHVIRATGPGFDPASASRFGFEALNTLETRLLARRPGNLPGGAASFFSADPPGTLLYTVKNADDGDGLIFRMTELTGAPTTATIASQTFVLSSPEVAPQNENAGGAALDMSNGAVLVPLQPYQTATVRVRAAKSWAPITLFVDKDPGTGAVKLHWIGGVSPYSVDRADDAPFTRGLVTPDDEQPAAAFDDFVLGDGVSHFYLVK